MEVFTTIVPIFAVILMGWIARRRGFIPADFLDPANRLVYSLSIPALIFGAIAKTRFEQKFDVRVVSLTLMAIALIYFTSFVFSRVGHMSEARAGSFILSSGHSNIGYIGLPIAYYSLGTEGFASASIICGFVMIFQNVLSVLFLQIPQIIAGHLSGWKKIPRALAGNPVIIGALAGMFVSVVHIDLPRVIWRIIDILGGLAPPMALLLIGASLSMKLMQSTMAATFSAVSIKLIVLPAVAILLFHFFQVRPEAYLPAVILLCSPAATIVYVMVKGMHGDADFAVTQISLGTLLSALTFILWLAAIPRLAMGS